MKNISLTTLKSFPLNLTISRTNPSRPPENSPHFRIGHYPHAKVGPFCHTSSPNSIMCKDRISDPTKHSVSGSDVRCYLTPPLGPKFYREAWWRRISRFLNKFEEDAYQKLISGLNRKCAREARLCSSLHRDSAFECTAATALIDRLWLNIYSTAVVPVALLCGVLNIVNKISKYFINKKNIQKGFHVYVSAHISLLIALPRACRYLGNSLFSHSILNFRR